MEYLKLKKIATIAGYTLFFAAIAAIITLSVVCNKQAKKIGNLNTENKALTEQVQELTDYSKKLAEINGIQVSVTFQLTQKNVLSQVNTNAQAIAKEICQMTRQQVLDSLSVYSGTNYDK